MRYEIQHRPRRRWLRPWRRICRYDRCDWPCPAELHLEEATDGAA